MTQSKATLSLFERNHNWIGLEWKTLRYDDSPESLKSEVKEKVKCDLYAWHIANPAQFQMGT